jgi:hypothetical protein
LALKRGPALRGLSGGCRSSSEKGIEYVAEAEVESIEPPPEKAFTAAVSKAVIGGTFVGVREYFVGFIDLLELRLSPIAAVMVRVVLKGQLPKCLPYVLTGGIAAYAQYLVVISFSRQFN